MRTRSALLIITHPFAIQRSFRPKRARPQTAQSSDTPRPSHRRPPPAHTSTQASRPRRRECIVVRGNLAHLPTLDPLPQEIPKKARRCG
eukprot:6069369-Pyramimonas_sp.AAC.1